MNHPGVQQSQKADFHLWAKDRCVMVGVLLRLLNIVYKFDIGVYHYEGDVRSMKDFIYSFTKFILFKSDIVHVIHVIHNIH